MLSLNPKATLLTYMGIFRLNGHDFVLIHIFVIYFFSFIYIFYEEMQ